MEAVICTSVDSALVSLHLAIYSLDLAFRLTVMVVRMFGYWTTSNIAVLR
jgi:hypothetical protein